MREYHLFFTEMNKQNHPHEHIIDFASPDIILGALLIVVKHPLPTTIVRIKLASCTAILHNRWQL